MTEGNGKHQTPREKRKTWLKMWMTTMKDMMKLKWKPSIVIYGRIEDPEHTRVSWHIAHPGMTARQATKIMCACTEALAQKAKQDDVKHGPRIITPGM